MSYKQETINLYEYLVHSKFSSDLGKKAAGLLRQLSLLPFYQLICFVQLFPERFKKIGAYRPFV
ncbi:hypothetical protein, partial [Bacillus amyloliquefaciens]|uniref:hypothetical protein n=1 Tax=Bacillus amyloliquefaciens TaxID=1390 RepID=UPI002DBD3BB3